MSDTPRTDNEAWSEGSSVPELVTAELARKLERELTAAKEELAATKAEKRFYQESFATADSNAALLRTETQEQARLLGMSGEREADLRGEIERLRRRVEAADGLATVLEEFADVGLEYYDMDMGPNGSRMLDASEKALAAYRIAAGKKDL